MSRDYDELRKFASAATPGPWSNPWKNDPDSDDDAFRAPNGEAVIASLGTDFVAEGHSLMVRAADAAFICAVSPDVVLALLDRIEALEAEREGFAQLRRVEDAWIDEGDKPLPEDEEIKAAFPTRSGRHDLYGEAMRMVGARYSKMGLVALVNMLLHRIEVKP